MFIFITALCTVFYMILGIGVFRMWQKVVDEDFDLFIILFWPIVLMITAIFNKK